MVELAISRSVTSHRNLAIVLLVSVAILLLVAVSTIFHHRKRRRRSLYQPFFGPQQAVVPKINKALDPIVYNYVCAQQPVDFVVPSTPATNAPPSPVEPPAASSIENAGALCKRLSLLQAGPTLLGGLNPELYRSVPDVSGSEKDEEEYPEGHQGRLWFCLEYESTLERLIVRVLKARNLPSRVYGQPNCCDPFVRIYLMPDERRYLQSKPKKKTCNPTFDETFLFQLPSRCLEERSLKFSILDNDRGKRHLPLGNVLVPLADFFDEQGTKDPAEVHWRDLEKKDNQVSTESGELMISLCYNQNLERLIVTVCEAKSLRLPDGGKVNGTFVRLVWMRESKLLKSKKTQTCRGAGDNPKYNESFHFRMASGQAHLHSVTLQVAMPQQHKQKERILGRVVLGPYMFSRGSGLEHWEEAMAAGHKQIRKWHKLV
ncbi:synaptotagmin-15-like [Uloborus diversus]|uniref:synaptotagmin-15-like n=1 Tax=Uloborus diversus TaxID=327109 RepID=UPI0024098E3F|nr:synaptotagmin-15-like [Uloborus diversus]